MDNSLKKIISEGLSNLSNAFNSKKEQNDVLGIDIGSSSIKIVQLKKKNSKAVLETYGVLSLGPYANLDIGVVTNLQTDELAKALIDVMKESNTTTKSAIIAIPSLSSLIFTLSLPNNVTENQLSKIIPLEAHKYIPVPISEVSLDWFIIPQEIESFENEGISQTKNNEIQKTEVLVVAVHNDTLSKYQDILKKTELHSDSFEMEIFSNVRSSLSHDLSSVLLIDFGASKTKVSIVDSGIVRVFHVVNRGSQDITKNISQSLGVTFNEAEKLKRTIGLDDKMDGKVSSIVKLSISYIFSDINSVVLSYEKKYNKNVKKVILVGGGSLLKGLLENTKENFNTEVVYSDPFARTETPAFLEPILKASGPEFAVAVGLALRQL